MFLCEFVTKSLFSTDHFQVQFGFQLKVSVTTIMCGVTQQCCQSS